MADSIVFIVANKKKGGASVEGMKYFPDCTVSISHTFDNDVTEHAVEQGGQFSDHVQVKNNMFSVSGIYNAKGIDIYAGDTIGQQSRVEDAYSFLKSLRDDKKLFTLISKYDSYNNCTIKSLRFPVAPTDGNTLIFEMDVTQIRPAKVDVVTLVATTLIADSKKDDASKVTNSGKSTTNTVTGEDLQSIFAGIDDATSSAKDTLELSLDLVNQSSGGTP